MYYFYNYYNIIFDVADGTIVSTNVRLIVEFVWCLFNKKTNKTLEHK